MKKIVKLLLGAIFLSGVSPVLADHHWEGVAYQRVPLGANVYAMIAEGGNIAVAIGEDGTFLVDDQFAPLTRKLLWEIEQLGGGTPRFLINTHWHFDHTGGNENLGAAGTLIVAHDNVRQMLSVDNRLSAFNRDIKALTSDGLPVITFSRDTSFHMNGETIRVFHVANAHTDGDAVVHFQNANVIHAGDVWFNGFYPFIDVEHGGSLAGMLEASNQIIALSDEQTKIIPGHGPVGNLEELVHYRDMLSQVLTEMRALKSQGKSRQEIISQQPIKSLNEEWGDGFLTAEKWLEIIYNGLEAP
ncbi:MBL fold metallo-hydrolase [Porticoccus sp.]